MEGKRKLPRHRIRHPGNPADTGPSALCCVDEALPAEGGARLCSTALVRERSLTTHAPRMTVGLRATPQPVIFLKAEPGRRPAAIWSKNATYTRAVIAQLAAQNPEVASSALTCHTAAQTHTGWLSSLVNVQVIPPRTAQCTFGPALPVT